MTKRRPIKIRLKPGSWLDEQWEIGRAVTQYAWHQVASKWLFRTRVRTLHISQLFVEMLIIHEIKDFLTCRIIWWLIIGDSFCLSTFYLGSILITVMEEIRNVMIIQIGKFRLSNLALNFPMWESRYVCLSLSVCSRRSFRAFQKKTCENRVSSKVVNRAQTL